MHNVIDGYNVIFAVPELEKILDRDDMETAREALLAALSQFKDKSRQEFTVVFDGKAQEGEGLEHPQKQLREGINVAFTEGTTADEDIEELISTSASPRNICVVTSDKRILRAARSSGCRTAKPMEFYDRIVRPSGKSGKKRTGPRAEPAAKYQGVPEGEVNYWLRLFRTKWSKKKTP